jgi:hypothetical protein
MTPAAMESIIRAIGREPRQRDTLYRDAPAERRRASFATNAAPRDNSCCSNHSMTL